LAFTLASRDDSSTFEEAQRAEFRQVLVEVKTLNEIVRSAGLPADTTFRSRYARKTEKMMSVLPVAMARSESSDG
jgi:hypothetical protein